MKLKQLFNDDDAVSPVIGVILMVAITVILAAVIGTFVLGLGDQVQTTSPQASFNFEQSSMTTKDGDDTDITLTVVTISHEGGDTIPDSELSVKVNGNPTYDIEPSGADSSDTARLNWDDGNDISAGSTVRIAAYDTTPSSSVSDGNNVNYDESATPIGISSDAGSKVLTSGDDVRVIWTNPNGGSSSTLGEFTVG